MSQSATGNILAAFDPYPPSFSLTLPPMHAQQYSLAPVDQLPQIGQSVMNNGQMFTRVETEDNGSPTMYQTDRISLQMSPTEYSEAPVRRTSPEFRPEAAPFVPGGKKDEDEDEKKERK
jgi:hypothetical protein